MSILAVTGANQPLGLQQLEETQCRQDLVDIYQYTFPVLEIPDSR